MKLFLKSKKRLLASMMLVSIISTVFLPVVASAQESTYDNSSENQKSIEIDVENLEQKEEVPFKEESTDANSEQVTQIVKPLFTESLTDKNISDKKDLEFFNDMMLKISDDEIFIYVKDNSDNYKMDITTYKLDYQVIDENAEKEALQFYNLEKNAQIVFEIKNIVANNYYKLTVTVLAEKLENFNEDIMIDIEEKVVEQTEQTEKLKSKKMLKSTATEIKSQSKVFDTMLKKQNVDYNVEVLPNNEGIYTKPYGMEGAILYTNYKYNNKEVHVREEATTQSGTFVKLVDINTRATLGWIKKVDVKTKMYNEFLSKKDVNYTATVLPNNDGIYTKPYGMAGAILYTNYKYNNKEVFVREEAITQSGTFVKLVDINTKATLGWIKKHNTKVKIYDEFLTKKNVNYTATVLPSNEGIYTKPYGMEGAILYTNYKYNNKEVSVREEATTQSGTFVKLVDINTKATLGWIKENGIKVYDSFITKHSVNYTGKVLPNNDGIYTKPFGMKDAVLYTSYKYNNKEVKIGEEATTQSGTFVKLIDIHTKATLGWINKRSISTQKVVFLDAGHGGFESGASYYYTQEKDLNLSVAKKIKTRLEKLGYIVVMSRSGDDRLSLIDRAKMANDAGVDIFVSVHHNAMPRDSQTTGIETYYYESDPNYPPQINEKMHNDQNRLKQSADLATNIHGALIKNTGAKDRGVRRKTFAVLRETTMPAVLLELGYMSSPSEIAKLKTDSYQNKLSESVAEGINKYFKK